MLLAARGLWNHADRDAPAVIQRWTRADESCMHGIGLRLGCDRVWADRTHVASCRHSHSTVTAQSQQLPTDPPVLAARDRARRQCQNPRSPSRRPRARPRRCLGCRIGYAWLLHACSRWSGCACATTGAPCSNASNIANGNGRRSWGLPFTRWPPQTTLRSRRRRTLDARAC